MDESEALFRPMVAETLSEPVSVLVREPSGALAAVRLSKLMRLDALRRAPSMNLSLRGLLACHLQHELLAQSGTLNLTRNRFN